MQTTEPKNAFLHLRANGWSLRSISQELGVPKSTLFNWESDAPTRRGRLRGRCCRQLEGRRRDKLKHECPVDIVLIDLKVRGSGIPGLRPHQVQGGGLFRSLAVGLLDDVL